MNSRNGITYIPAHIGNISGNDDRYERDIQDTIAELLGYPCRLRKESYDLLNIPGITETSSVMEDIISFRKLGYNTYITDDYSVYAETESDKLYLDLITFKNFD